MLSSLDKSFSKNNRRIKRPLVQRPTETANLHAKRAFKRVDFPDDCKPSILITKILSLGNLSLICPQIAENQASDISPASPSPTPPLIGARARDRKAQKTATAGMRAFSGVIFTTKAQRHEAFVSSCLCGEPNPAD